MSHFQVPPRVFVAACCAFALMGAVSVPFTAVAATPAAAKAPAGKAKAFDAKTFYGSNCASCHGAKGEGGFGPALGKVEAKGDAFIHERVRAGSPKGMPPFAKLSKGDMKALVAYVKGL